MENYREEVHTKKKIMLYTRKATLPMYTKESQKIECICVIEYRSVCVNMSNWIVIGGVYGKLKSSFATSAAEVKLTRNLNLEFQV